MGRTKKRKNVKKQNAWQSTFGIWGIVVLIACSLLLGILMGSKKGIAQYAEPAIKNTQVSKRLDFQPVLPTANIHVPILVYHYVEYVRDPKDTIRKSLDIIPVTFEKQIQTLKGGGYNFITTAELGQYLDGKRQLPQRPIVLTFDDGYSDFYTDVFPVLKKYNVVATEYIISNNLDKPNYMTTDEVKEIAESGLVEIGAHTVHHRNLKSMPLDEVKVEIEKSKEDLENTFGIKVVSFAYPYGGFNEKVAEFVRKAGFTNAVTTKGGYMVDQENRFTLFRIHPGAATGEGLLKEL